MRLFQICWHFAFPCLGYFFAGHVDHHRPLPFFQAVQAPNSFQFCRTCDEHTVRRLLCIGCYLEDLALFTLFLVATDFALPEDAVILASLPFCLAALS